MIIILWIVTARDDDGVMVLKVKKLVHAVG